MTLRKRKIAALRRRLSDWFGKEGRDLPWRRTRDPYAVLVSEFMLQQTQVATVLDYYLRWMNSFPTFRVLAKADEQAVLHHWQGLGYYARARNLHRAAKAVVENHDGILPANLAAIRALPGVGRYTAGAVASFAFDLPEPLVDANVARVLSRLFDMRDPIDTPIGAQQLWDLASEIAPPKNARTVNSALMELGALVCIPRQPRCTTCPIHAHCAAPHPEQLPVKRARRKTEQRTEQATLIFHRNRILLQQEQGRRWHGLWCLPKNQTPDLTPLFSLRFPIMHYAVTLEVYRAKVPRHPEPHQQWFAPDTLPPMPSPHRRAVEQFLKSPHKST